MEQFSQGYWEAASQVWVFNISTKENNSTYRLWLFFSFSWHPAAKVEADVCVILSVSPEPHPLTCSSVRSFQSLISCDLYSPWKLAPRSFLPLMPLPTPASSLPPTLPGATLPRALLTGLNVSEESLCRTLETHRDSYKWPSLMCMLSHFSPTLCDPTRCSPPGSSVHGILQARILEWIAMPSSRGSSPPRDWIHIAYISCISRWVLYHWATWEAPSPLVLKCISAVIGRNRSFGWSPHPGPARRTCWTGLVPTGRARTSHKLPVSFGFLHEAISLSLHHLTELHGNCLCLCFHWGLFDLAVWGRWTAWRHKVWSMSCGGPSHGLWFVLTSPQHNRALSGCLIDSIHWGRRCSGRSCYSGRRARQDFNPRAASGDLRVWRQMISRLLVSVLWKKVIILAG